MKVLASIAGTVIACLALGCLFGKDFGGFLVFGGIAWALFVYAGKGNPPSCHHVGTIDVYKVRK